MKNFSYLFFLLFFSISVCGCSGDENPPTDSGDGDNNNELEGYTLVWSDEFDGSSINTSKWEHEVNATGGGNNELQYYTARTENSYVENGELHIVARQEEYTSEGQNRYYTSARMRTANKGDWLYGRVEVRAKIPYGEGMWPAIWMLPTDWEYGGWPNSGEIDIMEHVGHSQGIIHGTVHTGAYNHRKGTQKGGQITKADADFNFHVYAIEWTENKIEFMVDGETYFEFENDGADDSDTWPFDKRFHLILNVAVGGDWPGNPTVDTPFPNEMVVDYVRVYQKD